MSAEMHECRSCLETLPDSAFYTSKLGHRNPICKECRRIQRSLCRKLEKLGHRFSPSLFVGTQRDAILKTLLEAGILKPADVPWPITNTSTETD